MVAIGMAFDSLLHRAGGPAVLDLLGGKLSGAELTTLLLAVMRRRASARSPAQVLRRYTEDRFTELGRTAFRNLRRVEDALLSTLSGDVEMVTLAPVAPLGTHSAVATVDQNKVVTTIRGTEVAADPTNGLALEVARRRQALLRENARSGTAVRLAAFQRVLRAQRFEGASAHFSLLGLVSGGRDTGDLVFERTHIAEHLAYLVEALRAAGAREIDVRVRVLDPRFAALAAELPYEAVEGNSGYYTGLTYKVYVEGGVEVADGGFVDWTRRLLGNNKERLLVSGVGIDQVASATG
ncbi:hypothetical protein [Micromonospora sp. CPCC 206061]|uniref:hypothetical protein n=1 Tax=Micromonospora sp. CPCC 206061 TaxID=3122410 RepID=UPI002FF1CCB6